MDHKICRILDRYFPEVITDIIFDYHKINNTFEIEHITGPSDYDYFNITWNNCVVFMIDELFINKNFENFVNDLSKNKTTIHDFYSHGWYQFSYDAKTNIFKQVNQPHIENVSTYKVKLSEGERLLFAKKLSEIITIKKND